MKGPDGAAEVGADGADGPGGVQRGKLGGTCLDEVLGELTVTGDENRLKFVGLMTPDIALTGLIFG